MSKHLRVRHLAAIAALACACGAKDEGGFDDLSAAGIGGTGIGGTGIGGTGFGGTGFGGLGGTGFGGLGGTGFGGLGGTSFGGGGTGFGGTGFGGTGFGGTGFGGTGFGGGGFGGFGGGGFGGFGGGGFGGFGGGGFGGFGGTGFGGTGGGGTGASGGSGGSGGGVLEDCGNGADDDGDGLIDCADGDCGGGYVCAPSAPAGWQGPLSFWNGPGSAEPPGCDSSYPAAALDAMQGLVAGSASCGACGCGSPLGMVCALATVQFFSVPACSGTGGALTIAANVCQSFIILGYDPQSVRFATAPPAGGACNPLPTKDVVPPLAWNERARGCGGADLGGGCGPGVCTPKPTAPFGALCIAKAGDTTCPPGYPKKLSYYQGANDTRGCTSCTCGTPQGAACPGSLELWTNSTCSVDPVSVNKVGGCEPLPPDSSPPPPPYQTSRSVFYDGQPPVGGTCASSGGQVTGSATPTAPVTVCCM